MQTKVPCSGGGGVPQNAWISKEEKGAPRYKAGRGGLTPLFCANAVRFMTRTTLIYTVAYLHPWDLKGKIRNSCQHFSCTMRRRGQGEHFFWTGSIHAPSLMSGSTWPVRDCLLKFFWFWTMSLATKNPVSSALKVSKGSTCSKTQHL